MPEMLRGHRKDAHSNHGITNVFTSFLLLAIVCAHVKSVTSTSRSLLNLPGTVIDTREFDIDSLTVMVGLGSSTQRTLFDDEDQFSPPMSAAGPNPEHNFRAPPPPRTL